MKGKAMQSQWEVKRLGVGKWALWSRSRIAGEPFSAWQKMGTYKTRSGAVQTGMILRERGEPISWPGGAIKMGIALVEPCKIEG
jgi:hypothetical protein